MTAETTPDLRELQEAVEHVMNRHHAPGVAVGIIHGDEEITTGFGFTNVENPLPVSEETLFQIGSITKTVTGTIAMRLVEEGKLDLDVPVRTYLPSLRLSDEDAAARVTMRHLLTHTSGLLGDYFDDPGRGDDALERMVERLATLRQVTPVGEFWSYGNAGFYLAGRVIEVIAGKQYEGVAREMVLDPLGMTRAFFLPEDVMTYSFAVGHEVVEGEPRVTRPWALPRVVGPVGGIIADVPTLLRYARFWMGDGTAPNGTRLLRPESMTSMQRPYVSSTGGASMGLTWNVREVDGNTMIGHGGGTNGQTCYLAIVPGRRFAIASLTNSDQSVVSHEIRDWALERYLDIRVPQPEVVELTEQQMLEYAGEYDAPADLLKLTMSGHTLIAQIENKGGFPLPDSPPHPNPPPFPVRVGEEETLIAEGEHTHGPVGEFIRGPEGGIEWLRFGSRMHRRL